MLCCGVSFSVCRELKLRHSVCDLVVFQDKLGADNLLGVALMPVYQLPAGPVLSAAPISTIVDGGTPPQSVVDDAAFTELLKSQESLPAVTLPLRYCCCARPVYSRLAFIRIDHCTARLWKPFTVC